jgi:sigma-E factor negative regulatory protein RseB
MTPSTSARILLRTAILTLLLPASAAVAQTEISAMEWLERIYSATQKLNYTGTFVYQHGQQVETSRITHVVDARGPYERLETLDGVPREIVRTREQVVCYLPASMTVKIDKQPGVQMFPAILPQQLKELSDNYEVSKGAVERVGGYECQVVVLEPKDRMRYGHRLWADRNSGMLLKAKTLDEKDRVLEQFAFTQLKIGGNIDREKIKPRFSAKSAHWRVEDSGSSNANLAESGWVIRSRPAGFRTVAELIRTLGGTSGVGHIVLSDGLAAVSVFIEPMSSKNSASQTGLVREGVINVYMRPVGNYWVTVIGEAPPESVKYIANAVEFRR